MARARYTAIAALFCLTVASGQVVADLPSRLDDGWHTWQVDEASASNGMCCFNWERGQRSRSGCVLDGRNVSFTNSGDCATAPGKLQVYVRIDDGKPVDIRVLSSNCPVSGEAKIVDLGLVSAEQNLTWFRETIEDRSLSRETREHALFGLVKSESDAAYAYLDRLLSRR